MAEDNREIVRRGSDAFNRGDWDRALADFAGPDFEFITTGRIPGTGGVYRGVDEFRRVFLEGFLGEFDDFHGDTQEIVQAGDHVFVSLTISGRGKKSGAETRWSYCLVWTLRDGKIRQGRGFSDRAEALVALGLSEADVQPS